MPNRIIREGILDSRAVNNLSLEAEVFYRRLMSVADDYGRYEADPEILRADLFKRQWDRWPIARIESVLCECSQSHTEENMPLIVLYEDRNRKYLQLNNFGQRIYRDKQGNPRLSKYPAPGIPAERGETPGSAGQSGALPPKTTTKTNALTKSNTKAEATTTSAENPARISDYPKTDAAVRRRFPAADLPMVIRIVEASVQAFISVDHPKCGQPSDDDIAEAVEIAAVSSKNQQSAGLFTTTVPQVIRSWAQLGRHAPSRKNGKSSFVDDVTEVFGERLAQGRNPW